MDDDNLFERLNDLSIGTGSRTPLAAIERIKELEKRINDLAADKINLRSENMELEAKLTMAMKIVIDYSREKYLVSWAKITLAGLKGEK